MCEKNEYLLEEVENSYVCCLVNCPWFLLKVLSSLHRVLGEVWFEGYASRRCDVDIGDWNPFECCRYVIDWNQQFCCSWAGWEVVQLQQNCWFQSIT